MAGFDRTGAEWRDFAENARIVEDEKGRRELLGVAAEEEFYIDVEYYEELELHGAAEYASFPDKGSCAVSVNTYGKGKAYYVAKVLREYNQPPDYSIPGKTRERGTL